MAVPKRKELKVTVSQMFPESNRTRQTFEQTKRAEVSNLIFLDEDQVKEATMNLKRVLVIQNTELNIVA